MKNCSIPKCFNKLKNLKSEHLTSYPNFKTLYNLISRLVINKNNTPNCWVRYAIKNVLNF